MSTKTTFKRVALVAVAALGLGVLSVAPSSAASTAATLTLSRATQTVVPGTEASVVATLGMTSDTVGDTATVTATLGTPPTGSGKAATDITLSVAGATVTKGTAAVSGQVAELTSNATGAASVPVTVTFTPNSVGTYVITLTAVAMDGVSVARTFTITAPALVFTTGDGTPVAPFNAGVGVAGIANTVTLTGYNVSVANRRALVTVSGADAKIVSIAAATTAVAANGLSGTIAAASSSTANAVVINTPTAGTVTVSLFNETAASSGLFSSTAAATVTITVNAKAQNNAYASNTVWAENGSVTDNALITAATTDVFVTDATQYLATASSTAKASFLVTQRDALGAVLTDGVASGVTITTTIGAVGTAAGAPIGAYAAIASLTESEQKLYLYSDGRSGAGVVTIAVGGVTAATFNVTFYSTTIASLTLTPYRPVIAANVGTATFSSDGITGTNDAGDYARSSAQFVLVAKDANGIANTGTAPAVTVSSSNPLVGTAALGSYNVLLGGWLITGTPVGTSGTTTITVANATGTITATGTMTVGSTSIASITMTTDATDYAPGDKVTVTLTAKDAAGNAIADGTYYNTLTKAVTSSQGLLSYPWDFVKSAVTGLYTADAGDVAFSGGKATASFFAPQANFTLTATLSASGRLAYAIQETSLTATATVTNPSTVAASAAADAAAEATDAANAATDAANAAAEAADAATAAAQDAADAVAALSTQVTELVSALRKQITSLTNLVIKIQKKVRA
jgi:trimeric autotransporter adhesin